MPAPETTVPASAEPAAREALEWSVWPARERPWAAGVLLASLAVLALLIVQATGDRVLAVAAWLRQSESGAIVAFGACDTDAVAGEPMDSA